MQGPPPPPSSRDLLPPLLACLPTTFISSRPPPALLPLLAPILRQRVSYLSENAGNHGWLPLLSWNPDRASKLPTIVQHMDLEPHPVSGELELEDLRPAKYQRLDEETLHARLEAEQFDLLPIYLWCERDDHGGTDPGWKLAELRALEDMDDDGTEWFASPSDAAAAASTTSSSINHPPDSNVASSRIPPQEQNEEVEREVEDNDDYWAAYDRTPGATPALDGSSQPNPHPTTGRQLADASSYYARYGTEVQPALDPHDPDEDAGEGGGSALGRESSTLHGDAFLANNHHSAATLTSFSLPHLNGDGDDGNQKFTATRQDHLSMPRPISPTSSHSSIERLEEQAEAMSAMRGDDDDDGAAAQRAIKAHIRTDLQSLFRLAHSAGVARGELEDLVRRELDGFGSSEGSG